LKTNHCFAWT